MSHLAECCTRVLNCDVQQERFLHVNLPFFNFPSPVSLTLNPQRYGIQIFSWYPVPLGCTRVLNCDVQQTDEY
jgi:hypothetical protein